MDRYNTWRAASLEVESALAAYPLARIPYSDVLNAFSRRTEAEINYFRAVVNYQRAIVQVHLRKGSLLEYDEVILAECPWPGFRVAQHGQGAFRRRAARSLERSFAQAAQPPAPSVPAPPMPEEHLPSLTPPPAPTQPGGPPAWR
jgi:hypothetical protein